jgi:Flp pilus assembly protein TadB
MVSFRLLEQTPHSMDDPNQQNPPPSPNKSGDSERTKQVIAFGWTAGMCALFAGATLATAPTWPVAFAVAAIAVVGSFVFCTIFKRA